MTINYVRRRVQFIHVICVEARPTVALDIEKYGYIIYVPCYIPLSMGKLNGASVPRQHSQFSAFTVFSLLLKFVVPKQTSFHNY